MAAAWAHDAPGGVLLEILVQPRASRTRAVGEHDGRLKVQLAAPPVDGEADAALIEFLADALGARRSDLRIVRGDTGRRKTVQIAGATAAQALHALTP